MTSRTICAIDTETTGLDPDKHDVFEVAYQRLGVDDEPITLWLPHNDATADPEAMEINRRHERWPGVASLGWGSRLLAAVSGAHLLGSNPAFDATFLRKKLGEFHLADVTPWHHRTIDIATYAMPVLGWDTPRGLADIRAALVERGHDIPEPDHSAAGDVRTLVGCWDALRGMVRR